MARWVKAEEFDADLNKVRYNFCVNLWQRIISPTTSDPDDARRQRALNIILVSFFIGVSIIWLLYAVASLLGNLQTLGLEASLQFVMLATLIMLTLIYWIGRLWSSSIASGLFLVMFTVILLFSDSPEEILGGRSMINLVLPIILASALLPPWTSLISAAAVVVAHVVMSLAIHAVPNLFSIVVYGIVAVISWLAANHLEQALKGMREINRELDQRVNERTLELSEALSREQKELSQSQAILDSIADSVLVFDLKGKLIVANPAFSYVTGKDSSAWIGSEFKNLIDVNILEEQKQIASSLLENPTESSASVQLDWGDQVFSLIAAPVVLESGQRVGTVAVLHDVTYEAEISRMKSSFVAMVSHELRTPLNAIMGLAEVLQQNVFGALVDKQQDVVERILFNTHQLIYMVKDLLNHAQIEAGTLTIQDIPFSPQELLKDVEKSLIKDAESKNLKWIAKIDPEVPPAILGDPQRLNQILVNLLTNAIKFTDNGSVNVRMFVANTEQYAMEVSDTGLGIQKDAQEQIFEPFWQVDTSVGRKHSGVGLGLSIVRKLIDLMDGEITLESEVGAGSTFTVLLPLHLPESILPDEEIQTSEE